MLKHLLASLAVGITMVVCTVAPARADSVVLTGGGVGTFNGIDLPGFQLTGNNSSFGGYMPISGVVFGSWNPGDTVSVSMGFPLSTPPMQPSPQLVNGVLYPLAFVNGDLHVTATPFVAPPLDGSRGFSWTTPFTATGSIAGYSDFARSNQLFSVTLSGSGTASISGREFSVAPNYIGDGAFFRFAPATSPKPEPASLLLFGAGFGAFLLRRRAGRR